MSASILLTIARAEALFASDLSVHRPVSRQEVTEAIRQAVRVHGGIHGCAEELALCYGEHPEIAASRMRWARSTVEALYRDGVGRVD